MAAPNSQPLLSEGGLVAMNSGISAESLPSQAGSHNALYLFLG